MRKILLVGAALVVSAGAASCAAAASSDPTQTTLSVSSAYSTDRADPIPSESAPTSTTGGTTGSPGDADPAVPDSTYTSAKTSVSIKKVTTGSGAETVTYFVADVQVSSGTDLRAASAGDDFTSGATADTSDIAMANDAVLAINGDYCGARDDGVIIRNGVLYRDAPARVGLAIYRDGRMEIYDEKTVSAEELLAQGVWDAYSFGPALLDLGIIPGDLGTYEAEAHPRHPIQGSNPRTAIGMIDDNHYVFVVVDGRQAGYSRGLTLDELAQVFKDLGCTTAYNLDGGGSSTLYFEGRIVNNPSGKMGERAISDILFVS